MHPPMTLTQGQIELCIHKDACGHMHKGFQRPTATSSWSRRTQRARPATARSHGGIRGCACTSCLTNYLSRLIRTSLTRFSAARGGLPSGQSETRWWSSSAMTLLSISVEA